MLPPMYSADLVARSTNLSPVTYCSPIFFIWRTFALEKIYFSPRTKPTLQGWLTESEVGSCTANPPSLIFSKWSVKVSLSVVRVTSISSISNSEENSPAFMRTWDLLLEYVLGTGSRTLSSSSSEDSPSQLFFFPIVIFQVLGVWFIYLALVIHMLHGAGIPHFSSTIG